MSNGKDSQIIVSGTGETRFYSRTFPAPDDGVLMNITQQVHQGLFPSEAQAQGITQDGVFSSGPQRYLLSSVSNTAAVELANGGVDPHWAVIAFEIMAYSPDAGHDKLIGKLKYYRENAKDGTDYKLQLIRQLAMPMGPLEIALSEEALSYRSQRKDLVENPATIEAMVGAFMGGLGRQIDMPLQLFQSAQTDEQLIIDYLTNQHERGRIQKNPGDIFFNPSHQQVLIIGQDPTFEYGVEKRGCEVYPFNEVLGKAQQQLGERLARMTMWELAEKAEHILNA